MTFTLDGFDLSAFVANTLKEDLGPTGRDVTSEAVIPADAIFTGVMDARHDCVVVGLPIAEAFFRALDPTVEIELLAKEGEAVAGASGVRSYLARGRKRSRSPWKQAPNVAR